MSPSSCCQGLKWINGRRLYVEIYGQDETPPVVLLHHGLGSTRAWQAQVPTLVEAGFRLVVYDRWGYGLSDSRPVMLEPSFNEDIQDLLALLDLLGIEQAALVGHSDGGTISLKFAALYPQRVCCLVSVAAHVYVEPKMIPGILGIRTAFVEGGLRAGLFRLHGDKVDQVFTNWFEGWTDPLNQAWDIRTLLAQISCPILVVQGDADEHATPTHAQMLAAAIQGAELWIVPGVGHMLPQDEPQIFNKRLSQFLRSSLCSIKS